MSERTRVFISYSQHDPEVHSWRVCEFAQALAGDGIEVELDQYHQHEPINWPRWCEEQLRPENSDFVLMICSAEYKNRIEKRVPADKGRGVFWEGSIIDDYLYEAKANARFIPILLGDESEESLPRIVRGWTWFRVGAFGIANGDPGYTNLYRLLTNQPAVLRPKVGKPKILPPQGSPYYPTPAGVSATSDKPPVSFPEIELHTGRYHPADTQESRVASGTIFICYRRADSADVTGRICDRLAARFPPEAVFKDVDSIPFGVDFRQYINRVLGGCRVMLAIIGRDWLNAPDDAGSARLEDPEDYLRIELETALAREDVQVIPVLVRGAHMPRADALPERLRPLAFRHAIQVRSDPDFNRDIQQLLRHLEKIPEFERIIAEKARVRASELVAAGRRLLESEEYGEAKRKARGALTVVSPFPAAEALLADIEEARRKPSPPTATKEKPFVNSLGMKFVPVPITGGPTDGQRVLFSIWETRVQDYAAFAKENSEVSSDWKDVEYEGEKQGPTHPVVNVSWEDGNAFCDWLTKKERAASLLDLQHEYRLPTDHEWSCAIGIGGKEQASASPSEKDGKVQDFPWDPSGEQWPPPRGAGNYGHKSGYRDSYAFTAPVGSFTENGLGLFDLSGNVWEWCEDWYDNDKDVRVLRGGSWGNGGPGSLRSSDRVVGAPGLRCVICGFRCVVGAVGRSSAL